jgi:hypothetical protein
MSHMQCWWLHRDRQSRCPGSATSHSFFCLRHQLPNGPDPADIYCLPEADMPPELVDHIRDCCPAFVFPSPPVPEAVHLPEAAPLLAAHELSGAGTSSESEDSAPSLEAAEPDASPAWLLAALREAIEGVMASDAPALPKANAVARLGNLYLKTSRATELPKEVRALNRRVSELERALALARSEAAAALADGTVSAPGEALTPARQDEDAASPAPDVAARPDLAHSCPGQAAVACGDGVEEALTAIVGSPGTSRAAP